MNQHSSSKKKYYSPLIGAALAVASLFHFSLPVFAAGTDAGFELKNRATATYEDQDNTEYNVISNEVTVTVGKIAGITNIASGNTSTGAIAPGDSVGFDFDITNSGNDTSDIYIPDVDTIAAYSDTTGNLTVNSVEFSTDGTNFSDRSTLTNGIIPNVADNATITVRVNVTIDSGASEGDVISVQLGNTNSNDNSADTQNQPDIPASADIDTEDVRTETADNANTDVDGDPVNGQREASAVNSTTVGANPLAMPRILKTDAGVDDNGTGQNLLDDIITYNLQLDVLNSTNLPAYTNFNFTPEDLEGRDYDNAGTPRITGPSITDATNLILISDAIPENTALSEAVTPSGGQWTPVYTVNPLTTAAEQATWTETPPGDLANVTRVGWVYDANANGAIPAGSSITSAAGFTFKVVTSEFSPAPTSATSIYSMAQVFGSTDDKSAGTTTGQITFDESGDQNPNNFSDTGTPGPDETVTFTTDLGSGPVATYGFANPDPTNVDPGNNTGTGEGGEVNEVEIALSGVVTSSILNGPDGSADALGNLFSTDPADDNHDFQNKSTSTPTIADNTTDGTTGQVTTLTTAALSTTFNNTVQNPGTSRINNIILQPVSPEDLGLNGTAGELQNGTIVTITYGDRTATYSYDSSGTGSFSLDSSTTNAVADSTATEITIDFINGNNAFEDYTVQVTLPANTPLSTNYVGGDPTNDNVGGYPVPIAAYVDDDNTGNGLTVDDTYNVTINQAYTGFLKLVKRARVFRRLDPTDLTSAYDTNPVNGMDFADPDSDKLPIPGDRVEYEITFENISEPQGAGSGNVILRADDIRVEEDGTVAPNNWAVDVTGNTNAAGNPIADGVIDTLHVANSAAININTSVTTTITHQNSGVATTATDEDVTYYEAYIQEIEPGDEGTFTFQRKVSEESDTP